MRGRVMALWALAWLGSTPIGGPIVGLVGQDAGARWALVIGGLPTVLCGILALPALARIDRRGSREETPAPAPDNPAPDTSGQDTSGQDVLMDVTTGEPLLPGRS
jgi:MFS family permease